MVPQYYTRLWITLARQFLKHTVEFPKKVSWVVLTFLETFLCTNSLFFSLLLATNYRVYFLFSVHTTHKIKLCVFLKALV